MKRYRVGIIGLGVMGLRMLANMADDERFSFSGVWDPDPSAREHVANTFPDIAIASGPDEIIGAPETDLVYIACPPQWHKPYAIAAAKAGKPIFCEKPLGIDVAQSRELVAELETRKTPNIVNFIQAPSHAVELTSKRLSAGELGEITGVDIIVHFSKWPRSWQIDADWLRFSEQGGYTREVFSHFTFLTERFLGKARLDWSNPRYQDDPQLCETHIQARLDCSGVPVCIMGSSGGTGPERVEMTLWGTKKSHRLHDWFWLQSADNEGEWTVELAEIPDLRVANFKRVLDNVAAFLAEKPHAFPSMTEALSVQELIEQMLKG